MDLGIIMGKVRPNYIKNNCDIIYKAYPNLITTDFESNKELLRNITDIESKKLLNRMAGYLVNQKVKESKNLIPPKKEKKIKSRKKKKHKCKNNARGRRKKRI